MRYIIKGGRALKGEVVVSGSKNAALPILAASLLTSEPVEISNVPDIGDVRVMLELLSSLGAEYSFVDNVVRIHTPTIKETSLPFDLCKRIRSSLLLVGPLLSRAKHASVGYPGGCVLGKRPIDTHLDAFKALGVKVIEHDEKILFEGNAMRPGGVVLKEISVTGTENVIMAACLLPGVSEIRLAAIEPHVGDLCAFLVAMGIRIDGIGTHTLTVHGVDKASGAQHRVTSDYLEVGSLAIAAAATSGKVLLRDVVNSHLDALWQKLLEVGCTLEFGDDWVEVSRTGILTPIAKLDTGIFPKFPTDLQAPFMVLMSQAEGVSKVFETLFEGRLNYLFELELMGARVEVLNPHQAIIVGPTVLKGNTIASCDIRAGTAMLIAGLIAEGETEVTNINYIDRGYERFDEKLRSLGADIVRVQSEADLEHRALSGRSVASSVRPVLR